MLSNNVIFFRCQIYWQGMVDGLHQSDLRFSFYVLWYCFVKTSMNEGIVVLLFCAGTYCNLLKCLLLSKKFGLGVIVM